VCQILDGGLVRGNALLGGGFATVDQTGGNARERYAIRERDRSHGQADQSCTSLQNPLRSDFLEFMVGGS